MCGKAFQKRLSLQWLAGARNATSFDLVIPEGRRLIIQQITGAAFMPSGVKLTSIEVVTSVGPSNDGANLGALIIPAVFAGSEDGPTNVPDKYVFCQNVVAFAQGPNPAQVLASRTPEAVLAGHPQGNADVTVSGFLVDL